MLYNFPNLRQWSDRAFNTRRYPAMPDGETLYVIGDIHGRLDCLRTAHEVIDRDRCRHLSGSSTEIYLGDYVDRGPDSKGVIDRLLERRRRARTVFLAGNHELMMRAFLEGRLSIEEWRLFGGAATLLSYGADRAMVGRGIESALRATIPDAHRSFLEHLAGFHLHGDYCFVHAGLRPGRAAEQQSLDDLAWIGEEFLSYRGSFDRIVVHAHTPVETVQFRPNRINLDTGAYRTGQLAVLKLDKAGPRVLNP